MRTATVRDLRNHYSSLMEWIEAGEEICITRRGKPIARLVPEPSDKKDVVEWNQSPAVRRSRSNEDKISAEDARDILQDSSGSW